MNGQILSRNHGDYVYMRIEGDTKFPQFQTVFEDLYRTNQNSENIYIIVEFHKYKGTLTYENFITLSQLADSYNIGHVHVNIVTLSNVRKLTGELAHAVSEDFHFKLQMNYFLTFDLAFEHLKSIFNRT